jgi:hypothetical protein
VHVLRQVCADAAHVAAVLAPRTAGHRGSGTRGAAASTSCTTPSPPIVAPGASARRPDSCAMPLARVSVPPHWEAAGSRQGRERPVSRWRVCSPPDGGCAGRPPRCSGGGAVSLCRYAALREPQACRAMESRRGGTLPSLDEWSTNRMHSWQVQAARSAYAAGLLLSWMFRRQFPRPVRRHKPCRTSMNSNAVRSPLRTLQPGHAGTTFSST